MKIYRPPPGGNIEVKGLQILTDEVDSHISCLWKMIYEFEDVTHLPVCRNGSFVSKDYCTPFADSAKQIERKDILAITAGLSRLELFVKHCRQLKQLRPDISLPLFNKLKKGRTPDNFNGTRYEINIAATLAAKGVNFIKKEAPDFLVFNKSAIKLECTSIRLSDLKKERAYMHKPISALRKKSKSGVYGNGDVLFIDGTNIQSYAISHGDFDHREIKPQLLKELESEGSFGMIVIHYFLWKEEKEYYDMSYSRIDSPRCSPNLFDFAQKYCPITCPDSDVKFEWMSSFSEA